MLGDALEHFVPTAVIISDQHRPRVGEVDIVCHRTPRISSDSDFT